MTAHFNHTTITSHDPRAMAEFYLDILEAAPAQSWRVITNIRIGGGVMLQFPSRLPVELAPPRYACLVDEGHFERAYATLVDQDWEHWADPKRTKPGQINYEHGGRGVYLLDPSAHFLELITRPYL